MAHASNLERTKLHMKKLRKGKASKRKAEIGISVEEKERLIHERFKRTLQEEVDLLLYDYDHKQYPVNKYSILRKILNERVIELKGELIETLDVTNQYDDYEKEQLILLREKKLNSQINRIEIILNNIGK